MLFSIASNPRPTTTTQTTASPSGVVSDAGAAPSRPPRLMLFPAPVPRPPSGRRILQTKPSRCVTRVGRLTALEKPAPDCRIQLKFRHLHRTTRIIWLPDHPGDASCRKVPPDASPNCTPSPQPVEKTEFKTSRIIMSPPPTKCVTRVGRRTGLERPVPDSRTPGHGSVTICKHAACERIPRLSPEVTSLRSHTMTKAITIHDSHFFPHL